MKDKTAAANAPILVTGGTGTLGSLVVARLLNAGHQVRVLSRGRLAAHLGETEHVSADLMTGYGVDSALTDVQVVIHLAGSAKGDEVKARNLVDSATRAGARHLVYISVVGDEAIPVTSAVDRAMFGYFASKREAEQAVIESGVPWTVLHATQFFDLTFKTIEVLARLPIIPVPAGFSFQPIDSGEVADRLVDLALGDPAGRVGDMGGPRAYEMADLVGSYLRATGRRRLIVSVPVIGGAAAAIRAGANLAPSHAVGRRTWEDFLRARLSRGAEAIPVT